ncbi:MAG: ATP-binding protein [Saprospiraceae bacterium]
MSKRLIGRKAEIEILQEAYNSDKSEFVAVYGRRRVGKTFLIKELFSASYTFYFTGIANVGAARQRANFSAYLSRFFPEGADENVPNDWFAAFQLLIKYLEKSDAKKKIIFIDELPWLDTSRSDFIPALDNFWNGWATHRDDVLLIACGSATSWMINSLINNTGGLHNRVTKRIHLQPFTLQEVELFLQHKGSDFERYEIVQLYMALGGIPFYLEAINVQKSIPQNIDHLFFSENGLLRTEFQNLFRSLFYKHERHVAVIEALAQKAKGLTRKELATVTKLTNGGRFTKILNELEQCGFIKKYQPFGKKQKGSLYQLIDQYSLFFLKFVRDSKAVGEGVWLAKFEQPTYRSWSGYAFENVCLYHIKNIKKHLGIGSVYTEISAWRSQQTAKGAQIDLVLDRRDRVINLCEIKFSENEFSIQKAYAENLKNKVAAFKQETKTKKACFLTFLTTFGLKTNKYSRQLVKNELTMDALFD